MNLIDVETAGNSAKPGSNCLSEDWESAAWFRENRAVAFRAQLRAWGLNKFSNEMNNFFVSVTSFVGEYP